jgi:hypothetical protein
VIQVGHRGDAIYTFFCQASDTLPTSWVGNAIPIGSDLYITDKYQHLVWTGNAWASQVEDVVESPVYNPLLVTMSETFFQILSELRCMRLALTKLATDGGGNPLDYDPKFILTDAEMSDQQQN